MDNKDLVIDVEGLSKSFNGKPAVKNVSLQVARGEIYGFLGPNGSGKTTSIRMICGLLTPDSAQGTCLGYNVLTESYQIKQHVGYMTQRFSLYPDLSIYENLDFMACLYNVPNRSDAVEQSIKDLGLADRKNQLAGTLSGGWKQRLALSAALIHKPQLLLLDEPTAGVDPKARREFWSQIQHLATLGVTSLVSTHYMDEAVRCNHLAYIFNGDMITQGTAQEIIDSSGLYTWEVTGKGDYNKLAKKLMTMPGIEQASAFGNKLHVSSSDDKLLKNTMDELQTDEWSCLEIKPDLEDVFIHLSKD
jgi:ABC-2 type transport system ATP-binding protein